ncbi:hypothetical protein GCM10011391_20020 [Pullulanibacillus camelliae]|uniref:DUF3397 domain-containing protein n=1 Tax=Pullulanibacillus camelliae TaxID=1707096 RepID=A0A8J2YDW9_9BACL|nr:DUF3397 domain-containing protein [Pullulanibacillus camelliae]GGE41266.1 hypothetical protein GCM10011391_20020 [Pullulanibacillus camelliae]
MTLFIYLFAFIITAPIAALIALYWLFKGVLGNAKRALHWSVDITTFILMLSVDAVMHEIWHQHFFGTLFFAFLFISILFILVSVLLREEVVMTKLIKGIWRFNFLLFLSGYFVLIVYGLIVNIKYQV